MESTDSLVIIIFVLAIASLRKKHVQTGMLMGLYTIVHVLG